MQINWSKPISSPFHLFLSSMNNLEQGGGGGITYRGFFFLKKSLNDLSVPSNPEQKIGLKGKNSK